MSDFDVGTPRPRYPPRKRGRRHWRADPDQQHAGIRRHRADSRSRQGVCDRLGRPHQGCQDAAHWEKKAFRRMDKSMAIVSEGGDPTWVANEDNYVVPDPRSHHQRRRGATLRPKSQGAQQAQRADDEYGVGWHTGISARGRRRIEAATAPHASPWRSADADWSTAPCRPDPNMVAVVEDAEER